MSFGLWQYFFPNKCLGVRVSDHWMVIRNLYNEIKGMRVKEVGNYLKPMMSVGYAKSAVKRGLHNYHAKYIQTSSVDPVYHVCFGGMIFSYLVALPEERRHLEHKQHAKH